MLSNHVQSIQSKEIYDICTLPPHASAHVYASMPKKCQKKQTDVEKEKGRKEKMDSRIEDEKRSGGAGAPGFFF